MQAMASWASKLVSEDMPTRCNWFSEVENQIELLAELPQGWDSNGADSPSESAVFAARDVARSLAQLECPAPAAVTATRGGGIQFEWGAHGGAYLELECVERDTAEFFFSDPEHHEQVEGAVRSGDGLDEILSYISRTK